MHYLASLIICLLVWLGPTVLLFRVSDKARAAWNQDRQREWAPEGKALEAKWRKYEKYGTLWLLSPLIIAFTVLATVLVLTIIYGLMTEGRP